jgi:hypothetical protein
VAGIGELLPLSSEIPFNVVVAGFGEFIPLISENFLKLSCGRFWRISLSELRKFPST